MIYSNAAVILHSRIPVRSVIRGSNPHHRIGVRLAGSSTTHDPSTTSWTPTARTLLVGGIRGSPSTCHLVKIFVYHLQEKWCNNSNHQNIHRNRIDHIWQNAGWNSGPICFSYQLSDTYIPRLKHLYICAYVYLHVNGGRGRGRVNVLQGGHGPTSSVDPSSLHLMER